VSEHLDGAVEASRAVLTLRLLRRRLGRGPRLFLKRRRRRRRVRRRGVRRKLPRCDRLCVLLVLLLLLL